VALAGLVGDGVCVGVVVAGLVVAGLAVAGLAVAGDTVGVAGDVVACGRDDVQETTTSGAEQSTTNRRKTTNTRPGCHATPIRIRGWVDGASHCMIETRLLCGIATQPAVAAPSVTCRK
jgi:predicted NBD/HSP70 family sugar kinase